MNKQEEEALLLNVKSLTDHMTMVDQVFAALHLGRNLVVAFQCNHSGLYWPGDYLREWGRKYGIGLGGTPVSECLNSDYSATLPEFGQAWGVTSPEQIAYPVGNTFASLDHCLVDVDAVGGKWLLPALGDETMKKRMAIIIPNQMKNAQSNLAYVRGIRSVQRG